MTTELENEAAQSTTALGPLIGLTREDIIGAVAVLLRETASDPKRLMRHSQEMGMDMVKIMTGKSELAPHPKDKRFMDPAWRYNPFMRAGAQYYLAVQKGMSNWLEELELDDLEKDRARFISNIIIDSIAPTNTLIGNPTAQKRMIDSGGLSLIKGLKNAYTDLTENKGMVSQVDKRPFKLGENVATSKGAVVLRTEMMELIQYAPTTDEVYEIPQLTIPPQINKMYINDLTPEKSIVKWQVDNGIQTFVISWRNPSKEQGHWDMADYVRSCREAMEAVAEHYRREEGQCFGWLFRRPDRRDARQQDGSRQGHVAGRAYPDGVRPASQAERYRSRLADQRKRPRPGQTPCGEERRDRRRQPGPRFCVAAAQ